MATIENRAKNITVNFGTGSTVGDYAGMAEFSGLVDF
jgi:hypothetical protein